jgi:hypothetical protein
MNQSVFSNVFNFPADVLTEATQIQDLSRLVFFSYTPFLRQKFLSQSRCKYWFDFAEIFQIGLSAHGPGLPPPPPPMDGFSDHDGKWQIFLSALKGRSFLYCKLCTVNNPIQYQDWHRLSLKIALRRLFAQKYRHRVVHCRVIHHWFEFFTHLHPYLYKPA